MRVLPRYSFMTQLHLEVASVTDSVAAMNRWLLLHEMGPYGASTVLHTTLQRDAQFEGRKKKKQGTTLIAVSLSHLSFTVPTVLVAQYEVTRNPIILGAPGFLGLKP